MDPEVFALPDDIDAGEARRPLRRRGELLSHYVYIVDREGRLVGAVSLRQVLLAGAKQSLLSLSPGRVESLSIRSGTRSILENRDKEDTDPP